MTAMSMSARLALSVALAGAAVALLAGAAVGTAGLALPAHFV